MSEKKQIEEIRKDIFAAFGGYAKWEEDWQSLAEAVYNAGYRKQIEAEWITDEEGYVTCSNCGEEHTWDEFRPMYCDMCGARMKGGE